GAVNLAVKETVNVRRVEFLNATANPVDIQIMGPDGRAAILREVAKGLQMPVDDIIPSRERLAYNQKLDAQMAAMQPPEGAGAAPTETFPGGMPMGGQQANTVTNQMTGRAG
ncbi:hypothetical protein V6O07_06615, partial [Arthrospira platensis SPKY2]